MSTIGLDLGTSAVKAVRFDDDWRAVDSETENTVVRTSGGHSEQDMREVWAAAARVVGAVARRSPDAVALLALTAQGDGCWLVGADGEPVRDAILWNDARAGGVIDAWEADGTLERAFRTNGSYGASGVAHAQLRWLTEHEPDTLKRASTLLSCGSWVYRRLTGRAVLEVSDAANPFLDARTRRYDDELLEVFELTELRRLLPRTVSGPDRIAPLRADVAADLGLPPGTPIGLAPYDVVASATGAGVTRPGQGFAILGTTLCAAAVTSDPLLSRAPNGMTLPGCADDRWLIANATMIGTEVLDWTARLMGLADAAEVVALAGTAHPGDQPLLLPYLSPAGERSPFRDSGVRGSLLGLTVRHTRADIARATLDGLTLSLRDCLAATGPVHELAVIGGGARSTAWCQTISDATNLPVILPDTAEAGARGAVLTAAVDLGLTDGRDGIDALTARAVGRAGLLEPDPAEAARFDDAYGRFVAARN
ncbi:FGGY family carbohydrate kinase [Streptomyces sp. CA-249302]|uniref:FGGY family carbohydrate kinase n=1 Tax=Streptomyces sp. CA-249302 TaxID=3240058 RepID=UPI003D904191